jgi:hypothetical protein
MGIPPNPGTRRGPRPELSISASLIDAADRIPKFK